MAIHIALLMMVKNEHKRLLATLNSILGHVNSFVMYDTGSEDDTIDIARKFCSEHKIPFRLKQGEFVNFSESRNISLDFADTFEDIDYILLMDTNDELRGGDELRKACEQYKDEPNTGFLLCQEWWSGHYDKYYNVRLVKARQGWRYRGRVHEWMKNTRFESSEDAAKSGDVIVKLVDKIVLYQDRTADDDKTGKRFARDKVLLLEDHKADPSEPRTAFYLAQTCSCLEHTEDAFYYYKVRANLEGFIEEKYHALFRCGMLSQDLSHPWHDSLKWYIQAFELITRAEPLVQIAEYYKDKNWLLCYTFIKLACSLPFPENCILFVDKKAYDYTRWHLLGIAGWYSGFYDDGKMGCIKAIESGDCVELDKNNLKHYLEREKKEKEKNNSVEVNKDFFLKTKYKEIQNENPTLSKKQIISKAKKMWKNRCK